MGRLLRLPPYQRLFWQDFDEDTKQTVRKEFNAAKETWGLLRGIWNKKVFYLNNRFNYGRRICDRAIEDSKGGDKSQILTDGIIRVRQTALG